MKREKLLNRIKEAIPYSLLLSFTFFIFGPLQLFISNNNEFWFKLEHILPMIIISFLISLVLSTTILIVLSQNIRKYIAAVIFGLGFALYIQGNFINFDYGVLDGTEIDWGSYGVLGALNTVIWLLCIFAPVVLTHFWPERLKKVTSWISLFIIGIQVITVGTLLATTDLSKNSSVSVTENGMFSLSKEKNLVVFVLDTFDASYMNEIIEKRPEYKELFEDFTYYDNTLGVYPTTKGALPHILTGERYDNSIPYSDFIDYAFEKSVLYKNLFTEGFDIGVYISKAFIPSNADNYFINALSVEQKPSSYKNLGFMMYKATAFTYFPHAIKPKVWFYSGDFNKYIDISSDEESSIPYVINDYRFYGNLKSEGLSFSNKSFAFRLYHLGGAHTPYEMTEDIQHNKDGTSAIEESIASLNIVLEYIEQLKKANVFENTSILVMADHGKIGFSQNPILMIKRSGFNNDFSISSAPVSFDDILNTFLCLATNNYDRFQPNVFTWKEDDIRERSFMYYNWDDSWNKEYLPDIYEYITTALANENTRMEKTGKMFASSGIIEDFIVQTNIGKTLKFGNKGEMLGAIVYGFSSDEKTHVWNLGAKSKLVFQIKDKEKKDDKIAISFKFKYMLGSKQRIKCFINGVFIDEKSVSTVGKPISFIIPSNLVGEDGRVELEFEFPDARSIGKAKDNRTVAFAFDYMVIDYVQNIFSGVKVGNEKVVIDFSKEGNSEALINEGWHGQEEKHRWASDNADIILYMDEPRNYVMEVEYHTFGFSGDTHVLYNGNEIAVWESNPKKHKEKVILPAELCEKSGMQNITFITDNSKSPKESGTGNDNRILGIDVRNITLIPDSY